MSHYSALLKQKAEAKAKTKAIAPTFSYLCDFSETDPYYFIVKENGKIIAEGSLTRIKLSLDESYLRKKIKNIRRKQDNMIATIEY